MSDIHVRAPAPTYRLIPSQFPPIGLFDTVATAADLQPVMELVGWTNDRLVAERIARLPEEEWVFGRANSSVIMATFLHVAPGGMRFNGPDLGAWYASAALNTAIVEVAHHLRREAVARSVPSMVRRYRTYTARLEGEFRDVREHQGEPPEIYDPLSYAASQTFGEAVRESGGAGILYDSLRHSGGTNLVAYRPRKVLDVLQTEHFEVGVTADEVRIEVKKLAGK